MGITDTTKAGKAYANRLSKKDRPEGDFYPTPKSLLWCVGDVISSNFKQGHVVLEPCFGVGSISSELTKNGHSVVCNDLYFGGVDYLESDKFDHIKYAITNPPFSLWDEFVCKMKSHCDVFMVIGRLNYFGTASRYHSNIWGNLKSVFCFNRYVDYRTPYREDGLFHVGAMATAWFLFDTKYESLPTISVVDVTKYAKLGQYKQESYNEEN